LVESAEEVALYGGEETEKYIIERDYFGLVKHINRVLRMRIWHGIVEEGIIKYVNSHFTTEKPLNRSLGGCGEVLD